MFATENSFSLHLGATVAQMTFEKQLSLGLI